MPRRIRQLDLFHLKFYGSVLGARPEKIDDDYLDDRMLAQTKTKKLWRKKVRRDAPEPKELRRADDDGQRAG